MTTMKSENKLIWTHKNCPVIILLSGDLNALLQLDAGEHTLPRPAVVRQRAALVALEPHAVASHQLDDARVAGARVLRAARRRDARAELLVVVFHHQYAGFGVVFADDTASNSNTIRSIYNHMDGNSLKWGEKSNS